ncbi:MAG: stability/partitioning determinant [Gammaproteobacteria bacterium]
MSAERASIFTEEEPDLGAVFKPKPARAPADPVVKDQVRAVSEAANFRSREPKPAAAAAPKREQRRYRTGRNIQLNIKARAADVEAFYDIADRQKWVLGETFQRAIEALTRELERSKS